MRLFSEWDKKGGEVFLGVTAHGVPNLLFIVGPNTGLGHNSIIHMMESQFNYVVSYVKKLRRLKNKKSYFNTKQEVQDKFNVAIQMKLATMIWSTGCCKSYYLLNGDGKNTSIWPGSTVSYRRKTRRMKLRHYEIHQPE